MKPIILLCLSLFVFVSTTAPTAIAIDLVASQTITAGTNVEVKLSVKPTGNAMVLKALSGLKIKKDSTSVDLTCTIATAGIACAADTATTVPCTATLSVAGSYALDNSVTVALTVTESDGTAIASPPTPSLGNTAATVNAASSGSGDNSSSGNSGSGNSAEEEGSKFMGISFLLFLFCFLL